MRKATATATDTRRDDGRMQTSKKRHFGKSVPVLTVVTAEVRWRTVRRCSLSISKGRPRGSMSKGRKREQDQEQPFQTRSRRILERRIPYCHMIKFYKKRNPSKLV
jgi:hypothetical protein